jgi:peroxiredoxin
MAKYLFFFLFLPLVIFGQEKVDPRHIVKLGDQAPEFTLTFTDGTQKKLSDFRGKTVMLQFTASWCSVCRKEMPFIESEIWQLHKDKGNFVLFGIDFKEGVREINKITSATGITYPILLDPDGKIFELYAEKGAGVTRNIIIGPDGKIEWLTRLFTREEFDQMKLKIESLLSK